MPAKSFQTINHILNKYSKLLSQVDDWFSRVQKRYPADVVCGKGCYDCCIGLFDISLLDAYHLRQGFNQLEKSVQQNVSQRAVKILKEIRKVQPNLNPPYFLTEFADADVDELCDRFPDLRCSLLDEQNRCLLYQYRPMTCQLHGLPLVDINEGVYFDQWCDRNFVGKDAQSLAKIAYNFIELDKKELELFVQLTQQLFSQPIYELYLFIPAAIVLDLSAM